MPLTTSGITLYFPFSSRNHFVHNVEYASEAIRNEETGEVRKDMEDLANRMTVVRIEDFSEMDDAHYSALINVAISDEKTLQVMTVYDRMVEEMYFYYFISIDG